MVFLILLGLPQSTLHPTCPKDAEALMLFLHLCSRPRECVEHRDWSGARPSLSASPEGSERGLGFGGRRGGDRLWPTGACGWSAGWRLLGNAVSGRASETCESSTSLPILPLVSMAVSDHNKIDLLFSCNFSFNWGDSQATGWLSVECCTSVCGLCVSLNLFL